MIVTFATSVLHLGLSLLLTRYSLYWTAIIYVVTMAAIVILIVNQSRKVIREKLVD